MAERILIVEDEINIATPVKTYLKKAGFDVDHALTGADALRLMEATPPNLMVSRCVGEFAPPRKCRSSW